MERGFALGKKTKTMRLNMQRDGEWEKINQKNMRQGLSTEESIQNRDWQRWEKEKDQKKKSQSI